MDNTVYDTIADTVGGLAKRAVAVDATVIPSATSGSEALACANAALAFVNAAKGLLEIQNDH